MRSSPRDVELELHFEPPLGGTEPSGTHLLGGSLGVRFLDLFLVEGGANLIVMGGSGNFPAAAVEPFVRAGLSVPLTDGRVRERGWVVRIPVLATYSVVPFDVCYDDSCSSTELPFVGGMTGLDFVHWRGGVGFTLRALVGVERELGAHPRWQGDTSPTTDSGLAASVSLGFAL